MKKLKIILWSFLLSLIINLELIMTLGIDVQGTQILASRYQYRIRLKPINAKGWVKITYVRKPNSWLDAEKYLFAQKLSSLSYKQVLISVVVTDESNQEFKISLIFVYNSLQMFMDTVIYDFNLNSVVEFSINLQKIAPPPENSKEELQMKISKIIDDSRKNNRIEATQTISFLFQRFLTLKQIHNIFDSNNVPAILKLINKVPDANMNCIQQITYLSQIAAIGREFLHEKKLKQGQFANKFKSKQNQKSNIQSPQPSQSQQAASNQQKNQGQKNMTDQRQSIMKDVKNLQRIYMSQISDLKQIYELENQQQSQISKKKDKIVNLTLQMAKIKQNLDSNLTRINEVSFILVRATQSQKTVYENIINLIKQASKKLQFQRERMQDQIKNQQKQLQTLMDGLDILKKHSKNLQTNISTSQQLLSSLYKSLLQLSSPSSSPFPNIYLAKPIILNLRTSYFDDLIHEAATIQLLSSTMSYLDKILDQVYFGCYGIKIKQIDDQNLGTVETYAFEMSYPEFANYIQNISRSQNGTIRIISNLTNTSKVTMQRMNIFSTIWTNQFGDALSVVDEKSIIGRKIVCYSSQVLETHQGLILSIANNVIEVQINGVGVVWVMHGVCTRLEVCVEQIRRGSLIVWRGRKVTNNVYNSYYSLIL